jgi:hypothetical protein
VKKSKALSSNNKKKMELDSLAEVATREAEIRRIAVGGQSREIVLKTLS